MNMAQSYDAMQTANMLRGNSLSGLILFLFLISILYILIKGRITEVAIGASGKGWYRAVITILIAMSLSVICMGVTLGAIISRQILRRNITVDWYSVLGGNILLLIVWHIPVVNVLLLSMLFAINFVTILHGYIIE